MFSDPASSVCCLIKAFFCGGFFSSKALLHHDRSVLPGQNWTCGPYSFPWYTTEYLSALRPQSQTPADNVSFSVRAGSRVIHENLSSRGNRSRTKTRTLRRRFARSCSIWWVWIASTWRKSRNRKSQSRTALLAGSNCGIAWTRGYTRWDSYWNSRSTWSWRTTTGWGNSPAQRHSPFPQSWAQSTDWRSWMESGR